jgi:hypothetical protein
LWKYNQSSLLNHFYDGGEFSNYWYERGTPSFLVKLLEKKNINITNMNNMCARLDAFDTYELDGMMPEVSLYQSGYLTISDYDDEMGIYTLDFPNKEVRASFSDSLVGHCR